MLLTGDEKPELFIVYTWCTKDPKALKPDDFPIHEVKLKGKKNFKPQLQNILKTAKMAQENNMIVVLNVERDSMPEENFSNLIEVLSDTPVKIKLCEPEKKFIPGEINLGNHVDITKAKACMDLHETSGSPAMSVDVDMELNPTLFLPWFRGHKDTPYNFVEPPDAIIKLPNIPILLRMHVMSQIKRVENGLIYYNYMHTDAKNTVHDTYAKMLTEHNSKSNNIYNIQTQEFKEYRMSKYSSSITFKNVIINQEDVTPEKIDSIPKECLIPWAVTFAPRENKAHTWDADDPNSTRAPIRYPTTEESLKLASEYKNPDTTIDVSNTKQQKLQQKFK